MYYNINLNHQTCLKLLDLIAQMDFALVLAVLLMLFDFVAAAAVLLSYC